MIRNPAALKGRRDRTMNGMEEALGALRPGPRLRGRVFGRSAHNKTNQIQARYSTAKRGGIS
jgi:hypothetical protein